MRHELTSQFYVKFHVQNSPTLRLNGLNGVSNRREFAFRDAKFMENCYLTIFHSHSSATYGKRIELHSTSLIATTGHQMENIPVSHSSIRLCEWNTHTHISIRYSCRIFLKLKRNIYIVYIWTFEKQTSTNNESECR